MDAEQYNQLSASITGMLKKVKPHFNTCLLERITRLMENLIRHCSVCHVMPPQHAPYISELVETILGMQEKFEYCALRQHLAFQSISDIEGAYAILYGFIKLLDSVVRVFCAPSAPVPVATVAASVPKSIPAPAPAPAPASVAAASPVSDGYDGYARLSRSPTPLINCMCDSRATCSCGFWESPYPC